MNENKPAEETIRFPSSEQYGRMHWYHVEWLMQDGSMVMTPVFACGIKEAYNSASRYMKQLGQSDIMYCKSVTRVEER